MDNKKLQGFLQKIKQQSNVSAPLSDDNGETKEPLTDLGDKDVEAIIANAKEFRNNCDISKYYIKLFSSYEDEIEEGEFISIGETCVFGICDFVNLIRLFGFKESEVNICKLYIMGRTKMFHGYSVNNFETMPRVPFRYQEGFDYEIDLQALYDEFGSADFRLESDDTYESIVLRFTRLQINDQTFDIGPFVDSNNVGDGWNDKAEIKNVKQFQLADLSEAYVDLNDGKVVSSFSSFKADDFVIPLEISHYHNTGKGSKGFGTDWRTNLDMQLIPDKKSEYKFIDAAGEEHAFKERYYYVKDGEKVFVTKSEVTIDLNGNLTYEESEVRKLLSCGLYTLVSEIKDFKGAEFIDGRQSEQAELEDYVKSYERSLKDYVKVSKSTGEIEYSLTELNQEGSNGLLDGVTKVSDSCIMPESDALQLQSLCANEDQLQKQKTQIENQTKQLDLQKEQINLQKSQIVFQTKQTAQQKSDLEHSKKLSEVKNGFNSNAPFVSQSATEFFNAFSFSDASVNGGKDRENDIAEAGEKISYKSSVNNIKLIDESKTYIDNQTALLNKQLASLEDQYDTLEVQSATLDSQIAFVKKQKDYIVSQSRKNLTAVKEAFTKYFAKKAELDLMLMSMPVNYLKDENGIVSGFNKYGNLCCVFDSYGNSIAIEFDSLSRIASVYDSKGKAMRFKYIDGLLESITDSRGRKVTYGYSDGNLASVRFADGDVAEFVYSDGLIASVTSSNGIKSVLQYEEESKKLIGLNTLSKNFTVQKNFENSEDLPYSEQLFSVAVEYGDNTAKLSYPENESEDYLFYNSKRVRNYVKTDKTGLKTEKMYLYTKTPVKTAMEWTNSTVEDRKVSVTEYDGCDLTITSREASPLARVEAKTFYSYDDDNRLVEKAVKETAYVNGENLTSTSITKYAYNAQGSLILTEAYVEGEELTSGINYEEKTYDDNGNVIKTVNWNSLDSSSKFYTQTDRAENGQVVADRDETGEVSSQYEYLDGTDVVNAVKQPNGSKLAYGRNPYNYAVTSVTQSTDDGEENKTDIVYNHGVPVEVKSGNTVIAYAYDCKGRKTEVSVNGVRQISVSHEDYSVNVDTGECVFAAQTSTHFVSGEESVAVAAQKKGVLDEAVNILKVTEEIKINSADVLCKNYDVNERLTDVSDYVSQTFTEYAYNGYGDLIKVESARDGETCYTEDLAYTETGNLSAKEITAENNQWNYAYNYNNNAAHTLAGISFGDYKFKPLTDVNGRSTGKEIYSGEDKIAAEYVSYRKVGDHATNMPACVWFGSGKAIKDSIKYKYDNCGNICEITENGHIVAKYKYDALNRLVRENNKQLGKTVLFSYDSNGNITERCEYAYTTKDGEELSELQCVHHSYDYDGDKLVSYNGETFAYNNLGSPTTYLNKSLQWQYGKRLINYDGTTFAYDGQGRRTGKGAIRFVYDNAGNLIYQSNGLKFIHDHAGVTGVIYDNKTYFYRKDVQGNIIAILDNTGAVVVKYVYDAWGNHAVLDADGNDIEEANHIGNLNPFRYRGYYYDVETGLYFLQTRYYDPETGRFISQDSLDYADPTTVNGLNLYAYCGNNPVMNIDPTGTFFLACVIAGLIIGAVVGGVIGGVTAAQNGATGWELVGAIFCGAIVGGVFGAVAGAFIGVGGAMIGSGLGMIGGAGGFAALVGGGVVAAGAAAGLGAVVLGGIVVGGGIAIAGLGVHVVFSRNPNNDMPMYGEPNSVYSNGKSDGIYDNNGHLIYRKDYFHAHNGAQPHTHRFKWFEHNGIWYYIKLLTLLF